MGCILNATEALDYLKDKSIILTCAGDTLYVSPRSLVTKEISDLIQIHKPDLLTLLASESGASSPAVERQAQQQGESHVPGAVPSHALSPAPCSHASTYTRPDTTLVCVDCGWTLAPGAPEWQPQSITSCPDGQHVPYADTPTDHPRQCRKCPYVWDTPAAETPRDPAVHDPLCEGTGLTVTPGVGWDCATCRERYRVPIVPAGVLHLWSELLQDDVYGSDSQATARELWATHRIAVYTPGELRRLRRLQRADPETFTDKLTVIHQFKREFGCHVDEVFIPQPQEQAAAAGALAGNRREGGREHV